MKISINQNQLVNVLQKVIGPTTTKINFPILNNVLIETCVNDKSVSEKENAVKFTSTDLEITIISFVNAQIFEEGKVTVPTKRIFSIARELPLKEVILESIDNNLLIKCEKIEFRINGLNPEEFPEIPKEENIPLIKINPQKLSEMIRRTSFSVDYENIGSILNGIFFEIFNNEITMVSTDGRRLSLIKKELPPAQPEVKNKISFILPIKAIQEIQKLIKDREEDVLLSVEKNRVNFDCKGTQLIVQCIEGDFPDYSHYLSKISENKLVVNRRDFLFALRRADLLSTPEHQEIKIILEKNEMTITQFTPQIGEVKENLEVEYAGDDFKIGFNPKYLIDVLKNIETDNVCFELFTSEEPIILKENGYIHLISPMRI